MIDNDWFDSPECLEFFLGMFWFYSQVTDLGFAIFSSFFVFLWNYAYMYVQKSLLSNFLGILSSFVALQGPFTFKRLEPGNSPKVGRTESDVGKRCETGRTLVWLHCPIWSMYGMFAFGWSLW